MARTKSPFLAPQRSAHLLHAAFPLVFCLLHASCCPCQQASAVVRTMILCLAESRSAIYASCLCIPFSILLPSPLLPPAPLLFTSPFSCHSLFLVPFSSVCEGPFYSSKWSGGSVLFKKLVWRCAGVPSSGAATAECPGRLQSVSQDSSSSKARGKTIYATSRPDVRLLVINHQYSIICPH